MYLLHTLGGSGLWLGSTPVEAVNAHRSALAVLTILATDGPATRDRLMSLLWPESDTPRARGSLKQTIHVLRHQTDGLPLVLGRATLHLNPEALTSDVGRFAEAVTAGNHAVATGLYKGAFLEGTHLSDSRALQEWVDSRRDALSADYRQALRQLIEAAEEAGDGEEAVRLWRRLQAEDPYDDLVALRLMQALAGIGQRIAALQHLAAHERLLRDELDLAPSAELLTLAHQLRSPPAEPAGSASTLAGAGLRTLVPPAGQGSATPDSDYSPKPPGAHRRRWPVTAGGLATLLVIIMVVLVTKRGEAPGPVDANLVAVAPFETPDTTLQLWGEGLTDILGQVLDGAGPLRTVAPSIAIRRWAGRADRPSAERFGTRTGAGIVVVGRLVRLGPDSVRLRATLFDLVRSIEEPDIEVAGEETRIGSLADSLGVHILRALGQHRSIASGRNVSIGSRSLPALKAFLRGEQYYRRGDGDSALAEYDRAITEDSTFALALRRMGWLLGTGTPAASRYASPFSYIRRAVRWNHGLSARDSVLLTVDSLNLHYADAVTPEGLVDGYWRSVRSLEELARRYPEDPVVWYDLGERRMHAPPPLGGFTGPALAAFERAVALDSAFAPAYMHIPRLAIQLGRDSTARDYADRYRRQQLKESFAPAIDLVGDILAAGGLDRPDIRQQIRQAGMSSLQWTGADHLRWWIDSGETAVTLLREIIEGEHSPAGASETTLDPLIQHQTLAMALAFRGHAREAAIVDAPLLADDTASPFPRAPDPFVDLALLGAIPDSHAQRTFARALDPVADWEWTRAFPRPPRFLGGLPWWFVHGDTTSLIRLMARAVRIERRPGVVSVMRARYYGRSAAAYLALSRGDSADALRRFEAIPDTLCLVVDCLPEKVMLAKLLDATGNPQQAAALLDRWTQTMDARPIVVLAALDHGRIAERMGDRETAAWQYRFVIGAWHRPDPELAGFVTQAQEGMRRLAGGTAHATSP